MALARLARTRQLTGIASAATALSIAGCLAGAPPPRPGSAPAAGGVAFLDTLEERTFQYFWELSDPRTGLTPDRAPTRSFASVAATGFALTAYPIGAERGYISRAEARRRVLDTLRFLWTARQDSAASGSSGYKGFFYHFLHPETGHRYEDVELSTMDTALLLAGVLCCQSYFDRPAAQEDSIRRYADSLYARADWQWASIRPPAIGHGWKPEDGFLPYDWRGYNEAMLLYILALGSPSHPVAPEAWSVWVSGYRWGEWSEVHSQPHVGFGPLFGHQYTQVWIDSRGIRDAYMRERGIDYFENSRRAVYAQQAYAVANPGGWSAYGPHFWGLTACDGPENRTVEIGATPREFHTYWARGASFTGVDDDGTVSPSAAAASIAFAPEIVIPTLISIRQIYGDQIFSTYGFFDALNPTFRLEIPVQHGRVEPELGWFDTDYLGIDQGPILAMVENYRTELIWRTMRKNPHIIRGLEAAGFTGGWLDTLTVKP